MQFHWFRKLLFVSFFILNSLVIFSATLSNQAEISVITCDIDNDVYAVYGHSAIRVKDPVFRYDAVYNYGIFDFRKPNFLYRFASGQTDYVLGVSRFDSFFKQYKSENRKITEQLLNLTQAEKQKIFDFLQWNAKPENRGYRYNYFYDNCASKIRDVMEENVDGKVIFSEEGHTPKTFRNLIDEYHGKLRWLTFGIDLIVCSPADKNATLREEMFLPDYLMEHFQNAKIESNGNIKPLVKNTKILFDAPRKKVGDPVFLHPVIIFLILFLLVALASFKQHKSGDITNWLDYLIYGFTGFMGLAMLWFVLYSEHPAMRPNYNLLWAVPVNLLFAIVWTVKKWRPVTRFYHVIISVWLVIFIVASIFIPQSFHPAFYLIALIVLSRGILHSLKMKR